MSSLQNPEPDHHVRLHESVAHQCLILIEGLGLPPKTRWARLKWKIRRWRGGKGQTETVLFCMKALIDARLEYLDRQLRTPEN